MYTFILCLSIIFLFNYKIILHWVAKRFKHSNIFEIILFIAVPALMTFIFYSNNYHELVFFKTDIAFYFYLISILLGIIFFLVNYLIVKGFSKINFQKNTFLNFNQKNVISYFLIGISEEIVYRYIIVNCFFILIGENYFWIVFITSLFFAINNFLFSKQAILDLIFKYFLGLLLGFIAFYWNVYSSILLHVAYNLTFVILGYCINLKNKRKLKYELH